MDKKILNNKKIDQIQPYKNECYIMTKISYFSQECDFS